MDIGTNSTRLLVVSPQGEVGRWETVTGLGRGLTETGLAEESMARTVAALERYGELIAEWKVTAHRAVATSAVRDAANREVFLDRAEKALGFRPETIGGERGGSSGLLGRGRGVVRSTELHGGRHRRGIHRVRVAQPAGF